MNSGQIAVQTNVRKFLKELIQTQDGAEVE